MGGVRVKRGTQRRDKVSVDQSKLAMRALPSKIAEDASQLPDLAYISVGPASVLSFVCRVVPVLVKRVPSRSAEICDWISKAPGPGVAW